MKTEGLLGLGLVDLEAEFRGTDRLAGEETVGFVAVFLFGEDVDEVGELSERVRVCGV